MLKGETDVDIPAVLLNSRNIAILGASDQQHRTSFHIMEYLQKSGYQIFPINPALKVQNLLGETVFDSVADLPSDQKIDIIVIFRNKIHTAGHVSEIIEWSENTGQKPIIWTQFDVSTEEAETLAKEAGLEYVQNHCIHAEHSFNL